MEPEEQSFALPGAAGSNQGNSKPLPEKEIVEEDESSLLDSIKDIPSAVKDAATGEGQEVEFPDIPEATDMGGEAPGLIEGIIPNLKIFLARDDVGKSEIMEKSFKGDERWGGRFQDKFGNPMIVWNDQPYYINKPGFSAQDFGSFVGETIKMLPAALIGGGPTVLSTILKGIPTYAATEVGSQALESQMTPETTKAKKQTAGDIATDVATATGIGVAADVVLPPALKLAGRAAMAPVRGAANVAGVQLPRFMRPTPNQSSPYIMTQGQRSGELPDPEIGQLDTLASSDIAREDILRRSAGVDAGASDQLRGFDRRQLDQIREDATQLRSRMGSGDPMVAGALDTPTAAAEGIQSTAQSAAARIKAEAGASYKAVDDAVDKPVLSQRGLMETASDAIAMLRNEVGPAMRAEMPNLSKQMKKLEKLVKISKNPNFKGAPLRAIDDYQRALNIQIEKAMSVGGNAAEGRALTMLKTQLNEAYNTAIERGLMFGDQSVIDQLQQSRQIYTKYMGLTGKQSSKDATVRASNKILEMITSKEANPKQVVGALFGHNKFAPANAVPTVIRKLKSTLGEGSAEYKEIIGLMKDATLERAFAGTGRSGVTRTNIVNNYKSVFGKNKAVINELFSKEELAQIAKFRNDVMPTLWAEIKLNPSGTATTILGELGRGGILNTVAGIPGAGGAVKAIEGGFERREVQRIVQQYLDRAKAPLFSTAIQAEIKPEVIEAINPQSSPALQSIIEGLSEEDRAALLSP
tara:strand:+ start:1062 stop:3317 length:2256 start_codon:yes stop_codon:yes gene_type:complete